MARPFAVPITLTEADCAVLEGWSRRRKTAQALALRARIVLAADLGLTNTAIAAQLGITLVTSPSGVDASPNVESKGCTTSRVRGLCARSRTRTWRT